jgi:hypothetical protein
MNGVEHDVTTPLISSRRQSVGRGTVGHEVLGEESLSQELLSELSGCTVTTSVP